MAKDQIDHLHKEGLSWVEIFVDELSGYGISGDTILGEEGYRDDGTSEK